MNVDLSKLALQELKQQKLTWVKENEDLLKKLAYAVLESVETEAQYTRTFHVRRMGGYTFYARESTESYDTSRIQYMNSVTLVVGKGEHTLAFYCFYVDDIYSAPAKWQANWLCIPGAWIKTAEKIIASAESERVTSVISNEEAERQKLLERMLDGVDIDMI